MPDPEPSSPAKPGDPRPTEWNAKAYDRLAGPMTRWGAEVLERLELSGSETVLDAGCGSGRVTEMLAARLPQGKVVALDASESMIEEARRRVGRLDSVSFVRCDLLELDATTLGDDVPLDAVFSTATFHWVLDHELLFANIAAVLRPGGQLVAQCGAHGNIEQLLAVVRDLGEERRGTWNYATCEDTTARLEACGFCDIEVWTNAAPTPLGRGEQLESYLETVCLRAHVASLPPQDRQGFIESVARAMPEPVIDYVRLNIVARRC